MSERLLTMFHSLLFFPDHLQTTYINGGASTQPYSYRKWKPIGARKFGYDLKVRTSSSTDFKSWGVKDSVREGRESQTYTLPFVWAQK